MDTISLINNDKAEIEELKQQIKQLKSQCEQYYNYRFLEGYDAAKCRYDGYVIDELMKRDKYYTKQYDIRNEEYEQILKDYNEDFARSYNKGYSDGRMAAYKELGVLGPEEIYIDDIQSYLTSSDEEHSAM